MAVAFEGFSIREYAAKMRSVDVMKCYPFKTDDGKKKKKKEDVEALLPPITVTKFKWWSHELHRLRASNTTATTTHHHQYHQEMLTLVNKESSEIPRNDIEFTAAGDDEVEVESQESPKSSGEPSSLVCPVCKDFSAATVNGVNAHMDTCLAQASREERKQMRKGKSKAPKKRSIADIFAVAPQVQTHVDQGYEVISEEDDDDDTCKLLGESNSNSASAGASASKMKAKKVKKRKKEKQKALPLENNNKKKKFTNKMKKKIIDGSIANKDNSCNLKLQSPVSFSKKLKKRYAMDIWDAVTVRARTPNLKYLSAKKRKSVQTSKSIPKNQKPTFGVRSILKNHDVCGHNSTFCSVQGDSQSNPCGIQHSERHVRFSDTDHILGPRNNGVSSFDLHNTAGNLISDSCASSSDKDKSAESNKEASPMEVDSGENDVSTGTQNTVTEACSIIGRKELLKVPDEVDIPRFLRPHVTHQEIVRHLPAKSVPAIRVATDDNNLSMFNQGYPTTSHKPAHAGIQRLISALEEPCVNTQEVTVSRAFDSCGKMIDQVVRPIHGFAAMSSKANTGAFPAPPSDFILNEHAKGRLAFLSQSEIDKFSDRDPHSRSLCPPMDMMRGPYPLPEWKQRVAVRERCVDDDFFGLPLNSHGELIQLSPGGRSGFNQLRKLNAMPGSSNGLPGSNFTQLTSMSRLPAPQNFTHITSTGDSLTAYNNHFPDRELPNDQLNLFPMQNYVKENPSSDFPDRFGVNYLESTQRADIHRLDFDSRSSQSHSFRPLDPDLNRMNISTSRCRQGDQVQNQKIGRMITKESSGHMSLNTNQPTMRLMGKDVAIGKSSRDIQRFEDGKVWTDKEIITENCRSSTALHNSSFDRNFQQNWFPHTASGKLKEIVPHSSEFHNELTPLQNLLMKTPEPRFPHPYQNWQSNSVFQNGSLTANRNPSSNLIHFSQLPTSPAMFTGAPNFQEQFITGGESLQSLQFGSQLPVFSAPQNTCGHGILRPTEFNYKQNPPHFTNSAFEFPFLNPECRENVQSPWFQSSFKGLPPWLLHASLPGKAPHTASQDFPYVGSNHHQHIMPTANTFSAPAMHHSSQISYPCNSMTSHTQLMSSPSPASSSLPPLAPAIQGGNPKPTSAGNRNKIKVKDRLKTKAFSIKEPYPCKKTKRRAVRAVDSPKPPDMLNLQMQEKISAAAGSSRGDFFSEMQSNLRATDLDSSWKKASDLSCCLNETQMDGFGTVGIESSGVDGSVRSGPIKSSAAGPIKLCAGAKHILKPTQIVDQDSSRPIHSTIPFVPASNGCREPEPQKKSTKVYRF